MPSVDSPSSNGLRTSLSTPDRQVIERGFQTISTSYQLIHNEMLKSVAPFADVLNAIHSLREDLRRDMTEQVDTLREDLRRDMTQQVDTLRGDVRRDMAQQVATLREDLRRDMTQQVDMLRAETTEKVGQVGQKVDRLQAAVGTLSTDMQTLRGEVTALDESVGALRQELTLRSRASSANAFARLNNVHANQEESNLTPMHSPKTNQLIPNQPTTLGTLLHLEEEPLLQLLDELEVVLPPQLNRSTRSNEVRLGKLRNYLATAMGIKELRTEKSFAC